MTDPLLRDALRLIQDIVMEAKGSSLDREAVRRVEEVLSGLAAPETTRAADTGYSRREATILFADLRGFSAIAEKYPPDVVLGVLSSCFGQMTEIIVRHYGTIDKFMGDAIMVVFHGENPSPEPASPRRGRGSPWSSCASSIGRTGCRRSISASASAPER